MREREGLIARIRQIRRSAAAANEQAASTAESNAPRLDALEARITHLERLVEGLQDSVHRESERHGKLIAELETQIQPAAMSAALSKDARKRGL
jgi:phage host-nuclease inhibitor protein Gam